MIKSYKSIETDNIYLFNDNFKQSIIKLKEISSTNTFVSFWNDITLYNENGNYNAIIEVPRFSFKKYEIDTISKLPESQIIPHFIKQDIKNGQLRNYPIPMLWNYGAFPQTWEDNTQKNIYTNLIGDNDPLDLIDISDLTIESTGTIVSVIPLGVLCMIDDNETDWKVICIQEGDKYNKIKKCNCLAETNEILKGEIDLIKIWFTYYKVLDAFKEDDPSSINSLSQLLQNDISNTQKLNAILNLVKKIKSIKNSDKYLQKINKFYGIDIDSYLNFSNPQSELEPSRLNHFHDKSSHNNTQLAKTIINENYQHWYQNKKPKYI